MADYERLQAALRTRSRIEVRYAVRHHESGRRWLMTRVEPAELGPQRGAFSVVTVDVTEEETARRRNQDLLTELTTILDVSPAGIAYLRGEELVRCNHRFETLLGGSDYPPGKPFDAILASAGVPAETVAALIEAVRDVGTLETELLLPAGTHRRQAIWCTLALRRTHETAPGAVGMVVVLADATRMKSQQSELEALARERELMFNLSDVGIVYQRDGQIERANQAMADLVGYAPEALKGSPMSRLYESEAAWQHYVHLETRDMATLGRSHGERQVRRRDGSLFWAQVSTAAGGRRQAVGGHHHVLRQHRRSPARARVAGAAGRPHARHPRLGAGGHRHRRRHRHRVDEPLGAPHVRRRAGRLRRRADLGRRRRRARPPAAPHRLRRDAGGRPGRDLRMPAARARRAPLLGGRQRRRHRPGHRQPPAHLRAAGHRAPPPGRGQHRAGARQPAAHHRDRAAGHRAVRRRQPAGGAAEPDGRDLRRPADEGDPGPRAVAVAARPRGREAGGRPAPRARHAGQRAARAAARGRRGRGRKARARSACGTSASSRCARPPTRPTSC